MMIIERLVEKLISTKLYPTDRGAKAVAEALASALDLSQRQERDAHRAAMEAQRIANLRVQEREGIERLIALADGSAVSDATSQRLMDQMTGRHGCEGCSGDSAEDKG